MDLYDTRENLIVSIPNPQQDMTPDRIRAIRERLGLTQEEAGRLLGGGPRAFTKYESGNMRPRAAAISLLRVLEAHPEGVWVLRGEDAPPARSRNPSPFEVRGEDLKGLRPEQLHELLRRLLCVEAQANGIPLYGIRVSSNVSARDGGEDGRISWQGGPERTEFLPSRLCQFQLKTRRVGPADAGREVLTRRGRQVKPMVRSVLERDGCYILLCTRRYPQSVESRERAIREALRGAGLPVRPERIAFWDADVTAMWINTHPPVALWVQEQVGIPSPGWFVSWRQWSERSEHSVHWVEDPRLPELSSEIRERLTQPGAFLRVAGLSGVGKSRLCLEALGGAGDDRTANRPLRDLVMYAEQSEVPDRALPAIVDRLAGSGARAVVVADGCDPESHDALVGLVRRSGSGVSLLSIIDDEMPSRLGTDTIGIDEAPESVVEAIVKRVAGTLPPLDRQRLARMSAGFPEVARRIGAEVGATQLVDPRPDQFIDRFVVGRASHDADRLLRSATLLSAFRVVRVDPTNIGWLGHRGTPTNEDFLAKIASLGRDLTRDDLYAAIQQFQDRGVFKRRGGLGAIQPRPIVVRLAERQWSVWDPQKWDEVLSDSLAPGLARLAAERLAHLNGTGIATRVVSHVCREGGPLDTGVVDSCRAEVLACLAEVDPKVVAECIERLLDSHPEPLAPKGNALHCLMRGLGKIAFPTATFDVGARLMLRLLRVEGRIDNEHSARPFTTLFPALSGATEADGARRLRFLDEAVAASDATRLMHVVRALVASYETDRLSVIGPEVHGSQRTLNRWHPSTRAELAKYVGGCISRLAQLAARNDEVGVMSRDELGGSIASLIFRGFIDAVEDAIHRVEGAGHRWTLALRQLRGVLVHSTKRIDEPTVARVQCLIGLLTPTDVHGLVRTLVTEPPTHHDWFIESEAEHVAALLAKIDALADDLLQKPETLHALLPHLSRGKHFHVGKLGESIANRAPSPVDWLDPIMRAVENEPQDQRNHDLLVGFVASLAHRHDDHLEAVKESIFESPTLAPAIPEICRRIGLTAEDVAQGVVGLAQGTIPSTALASWMRPETLDPLPHTAVARLLDALLDHDATSFAIGVSALWLMLRKEDQERNDTRKIGFLIADFPSQVVTMARNAGRWRTRDSRAATPPTDWCFARIVLATLRKGREDDHARETALAFSKALVRWRRDAQIELYDKALRGVLRELLSGFPGMWQIIGGAIVSNGRFARLMALTMGERSLVDRGVDPPILALPEEDLLAWCHASPDQAPAFAAKCLPILSAADSDSGRLLHPVMSRLIDGFGERSDVQDAFESNLHTTGVVSSLADHYASHEAALEALQGHEMPAIRHWARRLRRELGQHMARHRTHEQETTAGLN